MTPGATKLALKRRCAVYTRKSSEEGLEQEFNSLDNQREACLAYITSQRSEGWVPVPHRYDDGGYSGGNLERPALNRLLADIDAGQVDVVVVYKLDRLTRSLRDFHKLMENFEARNVTFVSVTQSFNTTSSMGRLTLNMMLSFAQFERELTSERIRDKHEASRRKGMWMGGYPVLGYDIKDRRLVVNQTEARLIRHIFRRFIVLRSATQLCKELNESGHRTKAVRAVTGRIIGNRPFDKTTLYKLLHNRIYRGEVVHKGNVYPGQHEAIVEPALWDEVEAILATNARARSNHTRAQTPALLKGLIFGPTGRAMSPTQTRKKGRQYRYYMSTDALKHGAAAATAPRISAGVIEGAVIEQIKLLLRSPEIVVATWQQVRGQDRTITENDVRDALHRFDPLWYELFPAEQARVVQLLVDRVEIYADHARIRLRTDGLSCIANDLMRRAPEAWSKEKRCEA